MKRCVAVMCALALPALAGGQSLGDAAKKEQARREKLREAGASAKTFTEGDLATTKGRLANDPNEPTPEAKAKEPAGETTQRPGASSTSGFLKVAPEDGQDTSGEGYWRGRVAEARARLAQAQRHYDDLQRMIRIGQPAQYDANGKRRLYSIYQMKAMADAAAADLAAAQTALENVLEDGRRSGALPGWLR
jgi:hypothetical protein